MKIQIKNIKKTIQTKNLKANTRKNYIKNITKNLYNRNKTRLTETATSPSINLTIKINRFILFFILAASFAFLNACVADGVNVENTSPVSKLKAIPGDRSVTLSWLNPNEPIESIDISYRATNSDTLVYLPLITDGTKLVPNGNVNCEITGLTNGETYTFTVNVIFGGNNAVNNGTSARSITLIIGSNLVKQDDTLSFAGVMNNAVMQVLGAPNFVQVATATSPRTGITYTSSEMDIATVDSNSGEVTILAHGITTITATLTADETYNEATASYTLTVNDLNKQTDTLTFENVMNNAVMVSLTDPSFIQVATSTNSRPGITYSSNETNVATVDSSSGEVTIQAEGTTMITATLDADATYNVATVSYTLTVIKGDDTLSFAGVMNNAVMQVLGASNFVQAATATSQRTAITYSSSDTTVATVDSSSGEVMILALGTTMITATLDADATYNVATASYTLTIRDASIPSAPVVSINSQGVGEISLSWNTVDNATRYKVYRNSTNVEPTGEPIATIDSPMLSYTDTDVTIVVGGNYYYFVKACYDNDLSEEICSDFSTTQRVFIIEVPGIPVVSVNSPSETEITVTWTAVTYATSYEIYRSESDSLPNAPSPLHTLTDVTTTNVEYSDSDSALALDTTYYYFVQACNTLGCSRTSVGQEVELLKIPDAPLGVMVSSTRKGEIDISWETVARAVTYEIYRNTVSNPPDSRIAKVSTLPSSYVDSDSNLRPATSYYYYLKACSDIVCSPFSTASVAMLVTIPEVPVISIAASTGSYRISIHWENVETNFIKVFRSETAAEPATDAEAIGEVSSGNFYNEKNSKKAVDDTNILAADTTYHYFIKACTNDDACSAFSNTKNAELAVGTQEDPFAVLSLEDLQLINKDATSRSYYYYLARDIDATKTNTWRRSRPVDCNFSIHACERACPDSQFDEDCKAACSTEEDASTLNCGECSDTQTGISQADYCSGFDPIGRGAAFTGGFDGKEFSIRNLNISRPENNIGLFGQVELATLKNISLENVSIKGNDNTGSLIGIQMGSSLANSSATGSVVGNNNTGGLVGNFDVSMSSDEPPVSTVSSISFSHFVGDVVGNERVGGLVGSSNGGSVKGSYASVDVSSSSTGDIIGGLIGEANDTDVYRSYSKGTVKSLRRVGGLIGQISDSSVESSYSISDISGVNDQGGGLIGNLRDSTLTAAYAAGKIVATGTFQSIGGVIGEANGGTMPAKAEISESYFVGEAASNIVDLIRVTNDPTAPNRNVFRNRAVGFLVGDSKNQFELDDNSCGGNNLLSNFQGLSRDSLILTCPMGATNVDEYPTLTADVSITLMDGLWTAFYDANSTPAAHALITDSTATFATGDRYLWYFGDSSQLPLLQPSPADLLDDKLPLYRAQQHLKAVADSGTMVTVSWSKAGGNTSTYQIYRNGSPDNNGLTAITTQAATQARTYSDTTVSASSTYYYWIKVCDASNACSDFSHYVKASTP